LVSAFNTPPVLLLNAASTSAVNVASVTPSSGCVGSNLYVSGSRLAPTGSSSGNCSAVISAGSRVTGGTLNATGSIVFKADRVGGETLLSQIVRMVGEAQRTRAPIQGLADRISAWFVPVVVLVAIARHILRKCNPAGPARRRMRS
jgi:high-affinity K+ transport system ATPase subunit B